jgi:hypothetical protein
MNLTPQETPVIVLNVPDWMIPRACLRCGLDEESEFTCSQCGYCDMPGDPEQSPQPWRIA